MAIKPSQGISKGANQTPIGARFRQRKISVKQPLPIYLLKDLPALDITNELEPSHVNHLSLNTSQQRNVNGIETGVDKNEEEEVHLQQVINAAQKALLGSKNKTGDKKKEEELQTEEQVYIPTPDASKIWTEAPKFYEDEPFKQPTALIKFGATVESTIGIEYCMDEVDEDFWNNRLSKDYPKEKSSADGTKNERESDDERRCSESEFEMICDIFEKVIEEKQPFLSMDPSNILSYDELSSIIMEEYKGIRDNLTTSRADDSFQSSSSVYLAERLSDELSYEPFVTLFDKGGTNGSKNRPRRIPKLLELFGLPIYEHWKKRKIERNGKSIHPTLKFEDPNASEKDNENDPYICFRRREFRQVRKTRRADTLGAEKIRMLQKSIHRARDIVLNVSQREILKLNSLKHEQAIFELRCETKGIKRSVGIKGDDHLFYPHKKKKIKEIKREDGEKENARARHREKKAKYGYSRESSSSAHPNGTRASPAPSVGNQQHQYVSQYNRQDEAASSSSQPYVKLPPSRIPDMDLVTVSLVLEEKNETIKRAVLEKLKRRKEQESGFVNLTDDPYQPYFNILTNKDHKKFEMAHLPYSSIAASDYHEFITANLMSDDLKTLLEEGKRPLPGTKVFRGSNGELIPSKVFPHLCTLLNDHDNQQERPNYITQLLSNIENNNFSGYNNGYSLQHSDTNRHTYQDGFSDPIFRIRRRVGRNNITYLDRRGLMRRPDEAIDSYVKSCSSEKQLDALEENNTAPDVYSSKADEIRRLDSRWKFDSDLTEYERGLQEPISLDPSNLNLISDETQSIRFGSMLLAKSYDHLREIVLQRLHLLMNQPRKMALSNNHYGTHANNQPDKRKLGDGVGRNDRLQLSNNSQNHYQDSRTLPNNGNLGAQASLNQEKIDSDIKTGPKLATQHLKSPLLQSQTQLKSNKSLMQKPLTSNAGQQKEP